MAQPNQPQQATGGAGGGRAAQHPSTTTTAGGDRPLSFYDNLTSAAIVNGGSGGRVIQFPDIQFRFDESIPDRRSVHSSAKCDFFGLSPGPNPQPSDVNTVQLRCASPANLIPPTTTVPASPSDDDPDSGVGRSAEATKSTATAVTPLPNTFDGGASVSASPTSTSASSLPPVAPTSPPTPGDSSFDTDHHQQPDALGGARSSTPHASPTIKTITIKLPDTASGPSEAVYMTTTVPQNFTKNANNLIGRHKPTRSSLRHSRMLVVNKAVPQRYPRGNSLNLRHIRLSKVLMVLLILIGLALSLIGLAITVWSPSTHTKDNPYWSGIVLILCGSLFLLLFEFKRSRSFTAKGGGAYLQHQAHHHQQQQDRRWRESCFHVLHVNALLVLLLTIFFTMLAFFYALIHTTNLSSMGLRCEPQFPFNVNSSTCVCTIDHTTMPPDTTPAPPAHGEEIHPPAPRENGTGSGPDRVTEEAIRLEYRDFNCSEVRGIWYYATITSTLLNSAGCLLAATFLVIYSVECILHRPEYGSHRTLACVRASTAESLAASTGKRANHPDTPPAGSPAADTSTVPLLQAVAGHPPLRDGVADAGNVSTTSSCLSDANRTTATTTAENNTLTTIVSGELEGLDSCP